MKMMIPTIETERMLEQDKEQILRQVCDHQCSVICIEGDDDTPPFGFSIGLWQQFRHPEILISGLEHTIAHPFVNACRDAVKAGHIMSPGHSYGGLLAPPHRAAMQMVHPDHLEAYMSAATWFYEGSEFPVLQAFWPDVQGRFPWDPECGLGAAMRQPRLQPAWAFRGMLVTHLVHTLHSIVHRERAVMLVRRLGTQDWEFTSPREAVQEDDLVRAPIGVVVQSDATLSQLAQLPVGMQAQRAHAGEEWHVSPIEC